MDNDWAIPVPCDDLPRRGTIGSGADCGGRRVLMCEPIIILHPPRRGCAKRLAVRGDAVRHGLPESLHASALSYRRRLSVNALVSPASTIVAFGPSRASDGEPLLQGRITSVQMPFKRGVALSTPYSPRPHIY